MKINELLNCLISFHKYDPQIQLQVYGALWVGMKTNMASVEMTKWRVMYRELGLQARNKQAMQNCGRRQHYYNMSTFSMVFIF